MLIELIIIFYFSQYYYFMLHSSYKVRFDNITHDTVIWYEHNINTNWIRQEKIIKTQIKIRYDTDNNINTIEMHEYVIIV